MLFQAGSLRATARYLRLCLDTVHLFASGRDPAEPESERWREAIRSADLWLLHLCDPEMLARELM
jgi:endonuclease IV